MNKKILKLISIFLCLTITLISTGCFSKKKKEAETTAVEDNSISYEDELRYSIEAEYADLFKSKEKELDSLKEQLALYDGRYQSSASFKGKSVLQAGNIAFNKVNDKIVLDKSIVKSSMEQAGLEALIKIGNKFTINPLNWIVRLNGNQANFSINNTAYGDISFYKPKNKVKPEEIYSSIIQKFLEANTLEELSSRDIFLSNKKIGKEVKSKIIINDTTSNGVTQSVPALSIMDTEQLDSYGLNSDSDVSIIINSNDGKEVNAYFRLGGFYTGNYLVIYTFISETENGSVLVDNLINSISQGSNSIYLN